MSDMTPYPDVGGDVDFHYLTLDTRIAIGVFVQKRGTPRFVDVFKVWGEERAPQGTQGAHVEWAREIAEMRACSSIEELLVAVDGEFCAWHLLTKEHPDQSTLIAKLHDEDHLIRLLEGMPVPAMEFRRDEGYPVKHHEAFKKDGGR